MYQYIRIRTLSFVIGALALVVITVFTARIWNEEKQQTCASQWLAYNTTANAVVTVGGSADADKVLDRLRYWAERCMPDDADLEN